VEPNDRANAEGNSSESDVINTPFFRMQILFDASQFSFLSSAPGVTNALSRISFRVDGASTGGAASAFDGSTVSLSITPRTSDNLSSVFADNVGVNRVVVYNGALGFGAGYVEGQSPQPFADSIVIHNPFYYLPAQVNLLLEIKAVSGRAALPGALDAQDVMGDSVSRVYADSINALTGTPDSLGLVTRFDFVVIPEPLPWRLALQAAIIACFVRVAKRVRGKLGH